MVRARIVGEVLVALIEGDSGPHRVANLVDTPWLTAAGSACRLTDLLVFAGGTG